MPVQGFILGKTTENKYVYIYAGQNLKVWNMLRLNTWLYFISSRSDIDSFAAILFKGGILDKLFIKSSLKFEHSKVIYEDDRKIYALTDERIKGELSICSNVMRSWSVEKGASIVTTGTELEIVFDERKDINSFSEVFGYILDLCKFLAFRKNVRFGEIYLKEKSKEYPEKDDDVAAKCFVRYDDYQEIGKPIMSCIKFNDIEDCIDNLLKSIVRNQPEEPQFSIGFIPENDKDVNRITSMKIREVCSALESEMRIAEITVEQDQEFKDLVKKLKELVKKHRKEENTLAIKAYDYIFGDLKRLENALADRIEKCFLLHQQEIGEILSKEQIDAIVGYRNIITHGNYMQLNGNLADTTFVLIKLVYCCILERIGISKDKVKDMMERRVTF